MESCEGIMGSDGCVVLVFRESRPSFRLREKVLTGFIMHFFLFRVSVAPFFDNHAETEFQINRGLRVIEQTNLSLK